MKNYLKQGNSKILLERLVILCVLFFIASNSVIAQGGIKISFDNGQVTTNGTDHFYEVDIMIQTNNGQADFKLGSGQTYLNYNTSAFGSSIHSNGNIEFIYMNAILGQEIDGAPILFYGAKSINDNTPSRVSIAFTQSFASSAILANNVTATPAKLMHIKIKYTDINEEPNVAFENDENVIGQVNDQYFSACGSAANGPFDLADCSNHAGTQFMDIIYDNNNPTLSVDSINPITNFSLYPNPIETNTKYVYLNWAGESELLDMNIYDARGRKISEDLNISILSGQNSLDIPKLESGIYFFKFSFQKTNNQITKQIIIK